MNRIVKSWLIAFTFVVIGGVVGCELMGFESPGEEGMLNKVQSMEWWGFFVYVTGIVCANTILMGAKHKEEMDKLRKELTKDKK